MFFNPIINSLTIIIIHLFEEVIHIVFVNISHFTPIINIKLNLTNHIIMRFNNLSKTHFFIKFKIIFETELESTSLTKLRF